MDIVRNVNVNGNVNVNVIMMPVFCVLSFCCNIKIIGFGIVPISPFVF